MQKLLKTLTTIGLLLLILTFGCTGENSSKNKNASLNGTDKKSGLSQQTDTNTLIYELKNSVLFTETIFDDFNHQEVYVPQHINAKLKPEFLIRFESQIAITIRPAIQGSNVFSVPLCSFDSYLIDSEMYGDLAKKCYLQIGEHDFNNDGIAEIVVAFGVKGTYLKCYIFQYHEPANISDAGREENWSLIGDFDEYGYYYTRYVSSVDENKIYFPVGSQGVSDCYVFVDNRFVSCN